MTWTEDTMNDNKERIEASNVNDNKNLKGPQVSCTTFSKDIRPSHF